MTAVCTTCPYCGVGCGVSASVSGARTITVKGDASHPANRGRLCSKGTHLGETVGLEGRLLYPEIGDARVTWDDAIATVADKFAQTIRDHGPDSVAFYVSGQLLTEDYYIANKLMKGFIGSGNIDTNSRLCMSSAVAAHNRAFGEDVVPCSYSDLDDADLIVLVGSNTAWCHPVIWQRIEAARKERGSKLVVIDPRRTETAERADLHLPIRPNGDVALFNGLLSAMLRMGKCDAQYLEEHVDVPADFWSAVGAGDTAQETGLDASILEQFYALFAENQRTVTLFSQGANQSIGGTDKGNSIINVHLATGRIGRPGMGPFSITGQPNAMGGREVGGLANMLACHRGFTEAEVDWARRFWNAPNIAKGPGLKAVDMFRAVDEGKIKAIWIMATNPAVSMPNAGAVRAALAKCPFVVVSDCIADTDTARFAHVKLPALAWGEKDGTVTNSERMISRQRGFMAAPGEARADWDIVSAVGRAMGWGEAFSFGSPADIFREYAAQTAFENAGSKLLNLGACSDMSNAAYDAMAPFQWGGASPFSSGRYSTADARARLVPVQSIPARIDPDYPLRLNTGRYRDQWHTMTRTGLSPRLSQHRPEPLVEVHPDDARTAGLIDDGLARVETASGSSLFRVLVTDAQTPGTLFVPMHWTDRMSSGGRTGLLTSGEHDPHSGQPGFKDSAARITPFAPDWRAFLVTRDLPPEPETAFWSKRRVTHGWLTELAGDGDLDPAALLPDGQQLEAVDTIRGMRRTAVLDTDGSLVAALFLTRTGELPPRHWIAAQLGADACTPVELLAGRAATAAEDVGPIICVCYDVGMKTILAAIRSQSLTSVAQVGAALQAGTNCGSCRPAIAKLIEEADGTTQEAAA